MRRASISGPESQPLRILERIITLDAGGAQTRFSYAVAGNSEEVEDAIAEFTALLATALGVLGLGLVAATFVQVRYGLQPLRVVRRELASIRSGDAELLEGDLPVEIEPLQDELNALLQSNRAVVERARTHVGNLAHALKTPLSVITNEADGKRGVLPRLVRDQAELMRNQINHHLERARMAGPGRCRPWPDRGRAGRFSTCTHFGADLCGSFARAQPGVSWGREIPWGKT